MEKMTNEQLQEMLLELNVNAEAKAEELSKSLGVKVHPIVFVLPETNEPVTGFIKEPPRAVKLRVLDKAMMGSMSAAAELFEAIVIKEETDPRMYSELPDNDSVFLGAVSASYELIKMSVNQFKKK